MPDQDRTQCLSELLNDIFTTSKTKTMKENMEDSRKEVNKEAKNMFLSINIVRLKRLNIIINN